MKKENKVNGLAIKIESRSIKRGGNMLEQLIKMICEFVEVDGEAVKEDSRFIEDLGFNSYDLMCLIGRVEEDFEIEVQEQDVVGLRTVREVLDYIQGQIACLGC